MIQSLLIGSVMGGQSRFIGTSGFITHQNNTINGLKYLPYVHQQYQCKKIINNISTLLKNTSNIFVMGGQK